MFIFNAVMCGLVSGIISYLFMCFFSKYDYVSGLVRPLPVWSITAFAFTTIIILLNEENALVIIFLSSFLAFSAFTDSCIKKIYSFPNVAGITAGLIVLIISGSLKTAMINTAVFFMFLLCAFFIKAIALGDVILLLNVSVSVAVMGKSVVFMFMVFITSALIMVYFNIVKLRKKERVAFSGYVLLGTFISLLFF